MANLHVLELVQAAVPGQSNDKYRVVFHVATPPGNNAAAVPWSTVLINAGLNKSVLPTGNGAGQITATELASITAGTLVELVLIIDVDASGNPIDPLANTRDAALTALSQKYNRWGETA